MADSQTPEIDSTAEAARALREYADLAESREHHMSTRPKKKSANERERNVWELVKYELRQRADALGVQPADGSPS